MEIRSKDNSNVDNNPWAGLASYEDPEMASRKLKFCGRDDDSYDLARLIMGNVFVTLYGKSGIGKTSLLNAGVFPELREKHYVPVSIRLGMREAGHTQSYQKMIVEAVERVVKRTETVNVIDEQQDLQSVDHLWNYFARHRFYGKYDEPTTPVIVLDQFEEVYRGHREEAETLLRQLDYLNDKDNSLDSCEVEGEFYRYEQNYRFVASIREDDLYRLEDSIDNCYLPSLKRCRSRLHPLDEKQARSVIDLDCEIQFEENEKEEICSYLMEKSTEDGQINTIVLSLLCYRAFEHRVEGKITYQSVVSLGDNPLQKYCWDLLDDIGNDSANFIVAKCIDDNGFRLSISLDDLVENNIPVFLWEEGSPHRLFSKVNRQKMAGCDYYELLHDQLAEALLERRREIKAKQEIRDNELKIVHSLYLAEKANNLVSQGNSITARLLALEALPKFNNEPDRPYVPEAEYALRNASRYHSWLYSVDNVDWHQMGALEDVNCLVQCVSVHNIGIELRLLDANTGYVYSATSLPYRHVDMFMCSGNKVFVVAGHMLCGQEYLLYEVTEQKDFAVLEKGFLDFDIKNDRSSFNSIFTLDYDAKDNQLYIFQKDKIIKYNLSNRRYLNVAENIQCGGIAKFDHRSQMLVWTWNGREAGHFIEYSKDGKTGGFQLEMNLCEKITVLQILHFDDEKK